uniref:Uncharacterized protein n=1 Tax=Rhizophora mucronata TaxID=61149 RepID=A0A2P2P534_RHIMU
MHHLCRYSTLKLLHAKMLCLMKVAYWLTYCVHCSYYYLKMSIILYDIN